MYEIASVAPVFGSRRDEYTAESAVAIHDGCGAPDAARLRRRSRGRGQRVPARPCHGRRRRADQPAGGDRRRGGHPGAVEAPADEAASASSTATTASASRARRSRSTAQRVIAGPGGCVDVPAGANGRASPAPARSRLQRDAAPRGRPVRRRSRSRWARRRASAPSSRAWRRSTRPHDRDGRPRTAGDAALTVADPRRAPGQRRVHARRSRCRSSARSRPGPAPTRSRPSPVTFKQAIGAE